jgi:large subunit ribosomal protein L20
VCPARPAATAAQQDFECFTHRKDGIGMARVKGAMMTRKRRKKVLKLAKGYWGAKSRHFKMAKQAVMKSGNYAFIGRKQRKRDFRRLWITRISAACRMNGINYSTFMNGLKKAGITLNRKMLSEIAIADAAGFTALVEKAKAAL